METKRVPLDSLQLDAANVRLHNSKNLDSIVGSLQRFGQVEPLIIQKGTGRILAGNGRFAAMRKLGWSECEIVELEIEGIEATALAIALNRTAELAEWDEGGLVNLLKELREEDSLAGVGFEDSDLEELLKSLGEPAALDEMEDAGPGAPPVNPVSRPGDLWLLGDHKLLCGDSTKKESYETLLGGEKVVLLSTDPPYCVNYTGENRPVHDGKRSGKDWSHVYREIEITDLGEFIHNLLVASLPHLVERAPVYMWHAHVQQPVIAAAFEKNGLLLHQILVWKKPTAVFGHSYYHWQHEPCAFGWKKGSKPPHGSQILTSVWECDWEGKARVVGNEHPTQKPLRLFEIPLEQHTGRGDLVLEPFSGSGSQLMACEKLARRCRAIEISPHFVDVDVKRWQNSTGKEAILASTGQTFRETAAARGVVLS